MRRASVRFVVFGLALVSRAWAGGGDCVPTEMLPDADAPVAQSSVKLRLVEPSNGAAVDANSVVVVEVDYQVARFLPDEFGLMMYFPALVSATSPHGPEGRYTLRQASGRVRLCVTMREVYDSPRLRWPLQMYVSLNKRAPNDSPRFSAVFEGVADSGTVALNSVAPTRETESLQASVVDPAYRDAVNSLAGTVAWTNALGQLCPRFPELEVEFTAAHGGWMSRNLTVIKQVRSLQRDLYARDIARADIVEEVMKRHDSVVLAKFSGMPEGELREQCRVFSRTLSDPRSDLQTASASQLAVIREKMPAKLPAER